MQPPVLTGGYLYAVSVVYSDYDSTWSSVIYMLNASTGKELWHYTAPSEFSSFATDGNNVYISSDSIDTTHSINYKNVPGKYYEGGVTALNAAGQKIWEYPINSSVSSPIIANKTVYVVSGDGNVYALGTLIGKPLWIRKTQSTAGSLCL